MINTISKAVLPIIVRDSEALSCMNMLDQYQNVRTDRLKYYQTIAEHDPHDCLQCGDCECECPRKLPIISMLRQTHEKLYAGAGYDTWSNHD